MTHSHGERASASGQNQTRLIIVLALTSVYLAIEVLGSVLTGSLALLADAGHMFTDVFGLGMAVAAIRFAQRPATAGKTYGFYRTEILAALANAFLLFGVAVYILIEAWQRFQEPVAVESGPMLVIAVGGLVINLVSAWLLRGGVESSLNVRGAFLEVVADMLGSLGVILAALIIHFTGWWQADPLISVVIGLAILPRTWNLLKSVVDVLLEAAPAGMKLDEIQRAIVAVPGVTAVHDLHVWTITSGFIAMSAHLQATGRSSEDVLHDVQHVLRDRFEIEHATLQVESAEHADGGACCAPDPRCLVVGNVPGRAVRARGG
jgi:cobalt-zinc-cadmium efflux system protein